uniref:Uncharacterized protein n=1 Tax=viral metagenome TaxID=1070528 RepID=A0A6C0IED6_9ZZZZ
MTSAGTLLSDLDGRAPSGGRENDDDLVSKILNDMNSTGSPQQGGGLPPPQLSSYKVQQPSANAMYQTSADPAVPTAHMIGREHPNPADFTQMMMQQQQGAPYMQQQYQQPQPTRVAEQAPSKGFSWQSTIFQELRQPILVAIIVFILSLPAVNILFHHYAPVLLRSGGDLNNIGLLARALIAGGVYWVFQRVIAPLMG